MAGSGIKWSVLSNRLNGDVQGQIRGASRSSVKQSTDEIKADIMRRMHIPGTGRIYTRNGLVHQASSPGQAPAAETGGLIASIDTWIGEEHGQPVGIVHSDHEAAAHLEYGAPGRGLAARPAFTPAGKAYQDKYKGDLETRLKRMP